MDSLHARMTNLKKRGFYEGGKRTLANRDFWNANSPFEETASSDRDTMRARARWLHENNPIMANIDKAIINNVIGRGIDLQSKIGRKKLDEEIERRFKLWCDECDLSERLNFADIQRLVLLNRMVDGEIFIYKKITDDGLKLQLIEVDALDTSKGTNGITIDANGKILKYHFSTNNKDIEIDAEHIINYFKIERPTQYRGVSEYKQAILDIKNFSAFQTATVKSARANAEIAYTVETQRDSGQFGVNSQGEEYQEINGLMVYYLRDGETISKHANNTNGAEYKEFVMSTVRTIAVARNVSYELAFRDYSQVNFASSRASLIQDNKRFDYEQEHLKSYFLNNIFKTWLEIEVQRGMIPINPAKFAKDKNSFFKFRWSYPKREWVDPIKDLKAKKQEIDLNLTTITDECAANGKDFEEILQTKKKEKELLEKYELNKEDVVNED